MLLEPCALLGLVTADKATHCRAYDAVMAGVVARHAADDSAFQATLGRGGRGQSTCEQNN